MIPKSGSMSLALLRIELFSEIIDLLRAENATLSSLKAAGASETQIAKQEGKIEGVYLASVKVGISPETPIDPFKIV
jgi:hypothetical protein